MLTAKSMLHLLRQKDMHYRIRQTGEIKTKPEIKRDNPNKSFPLDWNSEVCDFIGIDPVGVAEEPAHTEYEKIEQGDVVQRSDGSWVYSWNIVSIFQGYTDKDGNYHSLEEQKTKYQAKLDAEAKAAAINTINSTLLDRDWETDTIFQE